MFRIANDSAAKSEIPSECMLIFTALILSTLQKLEKPPE